MAHISEDRVLETSTSTGTGVFTLAGALAGFRAFSSVCATSDTLWYAIWGVDVNGNATSEWETGLGTYSAANQLTRTTVLESSNSGAETNFSAGTKYVAIAGLASRTVQLSGDLAATLPAVAGSVPTPTSGFGSLYLKKYAGRARLHLLDETGWEVGLQESILRNKLGLWMPPGNATTVPGVLGMAALSATGTVTARNVAATSFFTRRQRLGTVSAGTAGSLAGYRSATAQWTLGVSGTPNHGGFEVIIRFGCSDASTVSGARQFVGLSSSVSAPTNVEPSTLTNVIGVGHGASDTNLKIFYGGSAAQTPINLGANFPANTLSVDAYELTLYSPPGVNDNLYYRVKRLNTGDVADGTLTAGTPGTQLPSNTTFLGLQNWRTNNATALAVGLDFLSIAYLTND